MGALGVLPEVESATAEHSLSITVILINEYCRNFVVMKALMKKPNWYCYDYI